MQKCAIGYLRDELAIVRAPKKKHLIEFAAPFTTCVSSNGDQATLLFSCRCLSDGMHVHETIIRNAPPTSSLYEDSLLRLYAGFGASQEALSLFSKLHSRNDCSWTLLIRAFKDFRGMVLSFLEQMQQEGVFLSKFTSISILSALADEGSLQHAKRIHTIIFASALAKDIYVATAIVSMYGKCNSISNAVAAFEKISGPDTVAWNAMLVAYINTGNARGALRLFKKLIELGISPTRATFLSVLEACIALESVEPATSILEQIFAKRLQGDVAIGNAVINMYVKCGSLEKAQEFFDHMLRHDTISWNTMAAAYIQHGQQKDAIAVFAKIQEEKVPMDNVTFVSLLSACANMKTLRVGQQLHNYIIFVGLDLDVVVGTALVNMYGKCWSLEEAYTVFNTLMKRDTFTWNAMISAYSQHGFCDAAILLFELMLQNGVNPDRVTFVCILDACACQENLEGGCKIHDLIEGSDLEGDVMVGTSLIKMYGACRCLEEAELLFDKVFEKDIIFWNSMIALYVEHDNDNKAVLFLNQMLQEGVFPNKATITNLLSACTSRKVLILGKRLHASCVGSRFDLDIAVGTALTHMYGECGCVKEAYLLFDRMHVRDLVSWTTMISLHAKQEHHNEAVQLFLQLQQECLLPDVVTIISTISACATKEALFICRRIHASVVLSDFSTDLILGNALVSMYSKCGSMKESLSTFEQMAKQDDISFLNILCACASEAALREVQLVHNILVGTGIDSSITLNHALVSVYGKCGLLEDARKVFDQMSVRSVVAWNAMITACAQIGDGKEALFIFEQMQTNPDNLTYVSVLTACSHAGLVDEGCRVFYALSQDLSESLGADHCNCMLDILARAGQLDEAEGLIKVIPLLPTAITWTTLLGACKSETDITRGECVAMHAMSLVPKDVAIHVSLLNIYSAAGSNVTVGINDH